MIPAHPPPPLLALPPHRRPGDWRLRDWPRSASGHEHVRMPTDSSDKRTDKGLTACAMCGGTSAIPVCFGEPDPTLSFAATAYPRHGWAAASVGRQHLSTFVHPRGRFASPSPPAPLPSRSGSHPLLDNCCCFPTCRFCPAVVSHRTCGRRRGTARTPESAGEAFGAHVEVPGAPGCRNARS